MKFKSLRIMLLAFLWLLSPATRAAVTVTDDNGVIYDIVTGTMNVTVSANNATLFADKPVAVTIPATVIDRSTTAHTSEPYTVTGMARAAFAASAITSVTIEAPLTSLPVETFKGCTQLAAVTIPASVADIGNACFSGCTALKTVTDMSSVRSIGLSAFSDCILLSEILLPDGLTSMGTQAFMNCAALSSASIPSTLTAIPDKAFYGCFSMTELNLSAGVSSVGANAFQNCTALAAPTFPASLTYIGPSAFRDCTSLGKLTLTPGLGIGSYAFAGSRISEIIWPSEPVGTLGSAIFSGVVGLTSATVPGYIAKMPTMTFADCPDLETVTFNEGVTEVTSECFSGCAKLSAVHMPQTLARIGTKAFGSCAALTGVEFPSVMEFIDRLAFSGCSSFGDLTLPAGVSLANGAFHGAALTAITWPASPVGTIEESPFGTQQDLITTMKFPAYLGEIPKSTCSNWHNLSRVEIEEGISTIRDGAFFYTNALTAVTLPASLRKIEGQAFESSGLVNVALPAGLTEIGAYAFKECKSLESIALPEALTTLGNEAFMSCSALKTVECNDALKAIPDNAFNDCAQLATVRFGKNLETIGRRAFAKCPYLTGIEFPASLRVIGEAAFNNCSRIGLISLPAGVHVSDMAFSYSGFSDIIFPDSPCTFGKECFSYGGGIVEFEFPAWLTEIPQGFCRKWVMLEKVTIPDGVTEIGDDAFRECKKLHDVVFPSSLRRIGSSAFSQCNSPNPKFGDVHLYEGVEIGDNAFYAATVGKIIFHGCAEIGNDSFANVTSITEIDFPDCMETIPAGFCNGWVMLETVGLPEQLRAIGDNAFKGCKSLSSISFPAKLDSIGAGAFMDTPLAAIDLPATRVRLGKESFSNTAIESLVIPAWMDSIPERCFAANTRLASLNWADRAGAADSVVIGKEAFRGCSALESIVLPPVSAVFGEGVFRGCVSATGIVWSDSPLILGKYSFADCDALTSVSIPEAITAIPDYCFHSCDRLAAADLGPSVTSVGSYAFGSSGLSGITWSPVIERLGIGTFASTKFTAISIPGSVPDIPTSCFSRCSLLQEVTLGEGIGVIGQNTFEYCSALSAVSLPGSLRSIYQSAFSSCASLSDITLNEGLENIYTTAFSGCTSLGSVTFPSSVKYVGERAFQNCSALRSVINHGLDISFGERTFYNLKALESFTSDSHIKALGYQCFINCTALADFTCPDGDWVGDIGREAFSGCSSLRAFPWLSESVIGLRAFNNCTSLTQMTLPADKSAGIYSMANGALTHTSDYLRGASSLESVIFPSTANKVYIGATDFEGAPLRALSYCNAEGIVELGNKLAAATITEYKGADLTDKGHLMVKRGEKWKYMEAGLGKRFIIEEMRAPRIRIEGDIFSQYDQAANRNHYKVSLRWDVPLSDLNPDGPTEVEVFRDGVKIADVVFSQPSEPKKVEGLAPEQVVEVDVTVNGLPNEFTGDFTYPVTQPSGEVIYQLEYAREEPQMYFDAVTTRRQVVFDKYGYTSWFTMVDEFDSPVLSLPGVPSEYVYTARMKGYSYQEPVNNDGFETGADGKLYHLETRSFDTLESEPCVVHTAMAVPSLQFDGLYTTEEIFADRDRALSPTRPHDNARRYAVTYELDPDKVKQRGRKTEGGATFYVLSEVRAMEVASDGSTSLVGTSSLPGRNPVGAITIGSDMSPAPGKRYQTLTTSLLRGTFGSAVITVPEAPTLTAQLGVWPHEHVPQDIHPYGSFYGSMLLTPDVTPMGYGSTMPADGQWHLGMWRSLVEIDRDDASWASTRAAAAPEVLIHHTDGRPDDHTIEAHCPVCASGTSMSVSDGQINHTDVFDVAVPNLFKVDYNARLYVKVPEHMLRGSDRWMVADAYATLTGDVLTGVEDVTASGPAGDIRWFDLQGRPVADPRPGDTYIKITPTGNSKVVYK